MKAFTTLLCTLVALASAAAVPYSPSMDIAERDAAAALGLDMTAYDPLARRDEEVEVVTEDLPDGSNKVEIVVDGVSSGYLIIDADGEVHGFGGDGTEFDLDDVLVARAEGATGVEKRAFERIRALAKLASVIKKYGAKVVKFLICIGSWGKILKCAPKVRVFPIDGSVRVLWPSEARARLEVADCSSLQFVTCAVNNKAPWECGPGISCIGNSAQKCLAQL
ncbi:hypothetical protein N657DRAFT_402882 [Parathielavia appendiculata]|uniref:Uncharacterized protein n=1 Tax=Parathielavia appendiculata TaxID=2587402 RepID=A0AAN6YY05_9PEZI|nr:hypothetical protein N657DRAFT_402882 [Parathielavia appendiculata]